MRVQAKTVTTKEYTVTIQGDAELDKLVDQLRQVLPFVNGLTGYTELRYLAAQLRKFHDPTFEGFEMPEPGPVVEYSGDE